MDLYFRCALCKKKKFLSKHYFSDQQKICKDCKDKLEEDKRLEFERNKQREEKIQQRRIESRKKADAQLLQELKEEKEHFRKKSLEKSKKTVLENKIQENKQNKKINKPKNETLERQAEEESKHYNSSLYIYADVKRIKVIEWKDGKKRIAINKEREIRRTHKGGWSQEKFQKFIDTKKKQTDQWVEEVLSRSGVLNPPYPHVTIDTKEENLKEKINKLIQNINF